MEAIFRSWVSEVFCAEGGEPQHETFGDLAVDFGNAMRAPQSKVDLPLRQRFVTPNELKQLAAGESLARDDRGCWLVRRVPVPKTLYIEPHIWKCALERIAKGEVVTINGRKYPPQEDKKEEPKKQNTDKP